MKKLTKHQRQYRKRKKEANRDTKLVTREDGKRVELVARKQLCVRVNELAAERLTTCAEERNLNKGELLTHMILWGGGQVLDITEPTWYEKQHGAVQKNLGEEGIKYKGSTGTKQLNLAISSTAWNKLESYKERIGQSKARIVQSIILYYTFQTAEQLAKRKEGVERREQERREWSMNRKPPSPEEMAEFQRQWDEYEAKRKREQDDFFDSIKDSYTEQAEKDGRLSDTDEETS